VKAYLAHTFGLRHYIRDEVTPKLVEIGIDVRNPFYNRDGSITRMEVKIADEMNEKGVNPRKAKEWMLKVKRKKSYIVHRDLKMVDNADIVIAFMDNWSGGTTCEIFYMGVIKDRPVYLVTNNYPDIYLHPWMNYACRRGKIVKSLDELINVLKNKRKYR
jgi:nucleoside 2-deoxyribosyltransferase